MSKERWIPIEEKLPPLISYGLYVNAWQLLPENYKSEGGWQDVKAK